MAPSLASSSSPAPAASVFSHILHPTDFSPEACPAFAHAVRLAVAAKGHLTIVHAAPDGSAAGYEWEQFPKVRALLAKWGMLPDWATEDAVFDTLGVRVMKADLAGAHPAHGIAKYVERHDCNLIVLGTHSRDGLDLWVKGSVAADLAREARTPTLFVPNTGRGIVNGQTGAVNLGKVLLPVDFHPDPGRAFDLACAMAEVLDEPSVEFTLLHVGGSPPSLPARAGARATQVTLDGSVVEGVLETANLADPGLIVMATQGRQGFLDALRGSTTEQVVRKAARPVLAVPQI